MQWVYGSVLVVTIVHLAFTYSRGGQLLGTLSLVPGVYCVYRQHPRWLQYGLLALTPFVIRALLAGVGEDSRLSFLHPFARDKYLSSALTLTDRQLYWQSGWEHVRTFQHFWFGEGVYGFWPRGGNPHNVFLAVQLWYGFIGLCLHVIVLDLAVLRTSFGKVSSESLFRWTAIASCLATLLLALLEDFLAYPLMFTQVLFWFFVGLVARSPDDASGSAALLPVKA